MSTFTQMDVVLSEERHGIQNCWMKNDNPSNLFSENVAYWLINLIGIFLPLAGCSSGKGLSERQSFYFF